MPTIKRGTKSKLLKKMVGGKMSRPSGMVSKDLKDFSVRLSSGDTTLPKSSGQNIQVMPNNTVFDTKKMEGVLNKKGNTDYIPPATKKKEGKLRKLYRNITGK